MSEISNKILLVDDEPNVLQGFKRHLRKSYELDLAIGGEAAIELIKNKGPFAVVVSDMQMPVISGVELLKTIAEMDSQTVRIMLTGNADQKTAVDAVNEGHIFRFLNKPCPPDELAKSLDAGLEHYRLLNAEAELLNKTLAGSVRMLAQVLSMAMPEAFGTLPETRRLSREIARRIGAGPMWQVEMSSMLMLMGCVSLPKGVLHRYLNNAELTEQELSQVRETPKLGHDLICVIPRLQDVAKLVLHVDDSPASNPPLASRILKTVRDFQRLRTGQSVMVALETLSQSSEHDQQTVETLREVVSLGMESVELRVHELRPGMILGSHVEDRSGRVLIAEGNEVHEAIIIKLSAFRRSATGVREPIKVLLTPEQMKQLMTTTI